ncbi:hypothetical protein [Microcoleus sp. F4-D5]|uniref:hypothetical protein n=1 Tax=Microcoleus sp. F4-D5 TaxID=2818760 RepID=UPI002FD43605
MIWGKGKDGLYGDEGNDCLSGGQDADELLGDAGNDVLLGGRGNDVLFGDDGNNTLIGGLGRDFLVGANEQSFGSVEISESNLYVIQAEPRVTDINNADYIVGFTLGADRIGLANGLTADDIVLENLASSKSLNRRLDRGIVICNQRYNNTNYRSLAAVSNFSPILGSVPFNSR